MGSILVMRPVSLSWLTFGVLATIVAASTLLFLGEHTRRLRVSGQLALASPSAAVVPEASGLLMALAVSEGQRVEPGDPIATLRIEGLAPSGHGLAKGARISRPAGQAGTEDVLGFEAEGAAIMQRPAGRAMREVTAPRTEQASPADGAARADAQGAARLQVLRAPVGGVVSLAAVAVGQWVGPRQWLARVEAEPARMQAWLEVPASALAVLPPGRTLALRLRADARADLGVRQATVLRWSAEPVGSAESIVAAASSADAGSRRYRVTLDLVPASDGRPQAALAAGMLVEADLALEPRRLYQWLFGGPGRGAAGG